MKMLNIRFLPSPWINPGMSRSNKGFWIFVVLSIETETDINDIRKLKKNKLTRNGLKLDLAFNQTIEIGRLRNGMIGMMCRGPVERPPSQ
jgi:hypothetical protein